MRNYSLSESFAISPSARESRNSPRSRIRSRGRRRRDRNNSRAKRPRGVKTLSRLHPARKAVRGGTWYDDASRLRFVYLRTTGHTVTPLSRQGPPRRAPLFLSHVPSVQSARNDTRILIPGWPAARSAASYDDPLLEFYCRRTTRSPRSAAVVAGSKSITRSRNEDFRRGWERTMIYLRLNPRTVCVLGFAINFPLSLRSRMSLEGCIWNISQDIQKVMKNCRLFCIAFESSRKRLAIFYLQKKLFQ